MWQTKSRWGNPLLYLSNQKKEIIMTALSISNQRSWLERLLPSVPKKSLRSKSALALRYLLRDNKFSAEYDNRHNTWKIRGYSISLYDSLMEVKVQKDIEPNQKGQVIFTGGVLYQAETGRTSKTMKAGQMVWVVARYGNTLLVVDQQSALLDQALL
jgi:hypothetical protein